MTTHLAVQLAATELWLLPDKAICWPQQEMLLIADIHFGKAATYRQLGQPVPQGTTERDVQRLDQLLEGYPCRQLVFLGDFLHAAKGRTPAVLDTLQAWRERHPALEITLIRGNHDHRAGDPPASLGIQVRAEPWEIGPFALQHEPEPHPTHHVLAGHLHPAYRLTGKGRQQLRLPCFCLGERVSLLPAFGSFTGAMTLDKRPGQRIFVVGGDQVWAV